MSQFFGTYKRRLDSQSRFVFPKQINFHPFASMKYRSRPLIDIFLVDTKYDEIKVIDCYADIPLKHSPSDIFRSHINKKGLLTIPMEVRSPLLGERDIFIVGLGDRFAIVKEAECRLLQGAIRGRFRSEGLKGVLSSIPEAAPLSWNDLIVSREALSADLQSQLFSNAGLKFFAVLEIILSHFWQGECVITNQSVRDAMQTLDLRQDTSDVSGYQVSGKAFQKFRYDLEKKISPSIHVEQITNVIVKMWWNAVA